MDLDYAAARNAGISDDDILRAVEAHGGLDLDFKAARDKGFSSTDILDTLISRAPQKAAETPPESSSMLRRAGDVGISAIRGVIGVPEALVGLADIPTGGAAGRAAESLGFKFNEAKEGFGSLYSPEQKAANQRVADAKGFADTAGAMLSNPSTLLQTGVESLPSMLAGGVVGRGVLAVAPKIGALGAAAVGEGAIGAGQSAEQIRQQSGGDLSLGQAGAALASGIGTGAFGLVGGRIAQKLGIADIDTALVQAGAPVNSGKGVIRRMIEGGVSEGVFEELPQSMQETIWQNAAMDRPLLEGVPENAARGMLAGGLFGGIAGGALGSRAQPATEQPEPAPLLLTNNPDPFLSFPDGSVGRKSDAEAFIAAMPEDQRVAARARLFGMGAQQVTPEDVLRQDSLDAAIVVADMAIAQGTPEMRAQRNADIDAAWGQYLGQQADARQQEFDAAEQARREAEAPALLDQVADQNVAQADALTTAQGFGTPEPTALQLAMVRAQQLRQERLAEAQQRATIQSQPLQNEAQNGIAGRENQQLAAGDQGQAAGSIANAAGMDFVDGIGQARSSSGPAGELGNELGGLPLGGRAAAGGTAEQSGTGLPSAQVAGAPGVGNGQQNINPRTAGARLDAGNNAIATASGNTGNDQVGAGDGAPDLRITSPKPPIAIGDNTAETASNSGDARAPSAGTSVAESDAGATGGKLDVASSSAAASPETVNQARAILTAAGVTGNERMEALRNIRSGVNTLDDLIDAHPPKVQEAASANQDANAAVRGIPDVGTESAQATAPAQPAAEAGRAPVAQPVERGQGDAEAAGVPDGTGVSGADEAVQQPDALTELTGARTNSLSRVSSWVIRNKDTGEVVMETFDKKKVDALNTDKYEAVPVQQHLGEINTPGTKAYETARNTAPAKPRAAQFEKVERQQTRLEAEIEKAKANAAARKAPKKSEASAPGGMRAEDVQRSLTTLRAKWLGSNKVSTVQSVADLPADVRERAQPDDKSEGLYDPTTGQVYLVADNIKDAARGIFVAAHERIGHGGLRALKDKTVNEALNLAGANKFVKDLAGAIAKDRGVANGSMATEEAVAELAAAIETDDFQGLADRYGVDVPASARNGLRGAVARVLDAIKRFIATVSGKPVSSVSDADVRALIGQQREAVESGAESEPDSGPVRASVPPNQRTIEVDGVRRPITDSAGNLVAPDFNAQMAFWREYNGPVDSRGRPVIDQNGDAIMQRRAPSSGQWGIPGETKWDDLIYSMQDKQIDLKRVTAAIRASGKAIAEKFDAYLQEELFYGRSAKGVKDFLDLELRPLVQEMQMRGVQMSDFEEYLWNRHAEERNEKNASLEGGKPDGGSGIKTKDARAYLAALPAAKRQSYEALAKRIDAINTKTRGMLVASGLEKQSTIDAWNGAYKHYVPLQREDVETGGTGTGQGFSIKGSSSKRAIGSDKPVADILANIAMQRERTVVRAEKNRVATALIGLATANPNADFWDVDNAPTERVVEERQGKDTIVERVLPGFKSRDNVVVARINGEDHFVTFNEREPRAVRMAMSIKNLDADQLGRVLSATAKGTRYLAAINTQYNPIFGIVNLMRDTQGALLNLSTTAIAGDQKKVMGYTASALRGIMSDLRAHRAGTQSTSQWANLFEEFQNEGGQTGYRDQYSNSEQRAEAIMKEIKSVERNPVLKAGGALFDLLSDYNEMMENAVRLAAYRAAKERGLSKQQAASLAKNLTVNFNRKGQVATQVGALYAFFNASTQGTARLYETLTGPAGKKIIAGGILLGAMQAVLLAASDLGEDEPPEFVRSRSLIFPIGDKKYLTLPMPLGFHVLPNLGRIPMEFVMGGFRDPARRVADMVGLFADTFNPIGNAGLSLQTIAPSLVDPLAALAENRDWTGKPIARQDMNSMAPTPGYSRANDTATSWSKAIAYGLNIVSGGTDYKPGLISPTPDQLDYLIGQATGGVGRELSKADQMVSSAITGEELPPHKMVLAGRFYGDASGQSAESGKFYSAIKRINQHEAEIKGLREERKSAEVVRYMKDNREAFLVQQANSTESRIRKLKQAKRDAVKADRTEQVKRIEEQITATMAQFNKRVEAARKADN